MNAYDICMCTYIYIYILNYPTCVSTCIWQWFPATIDPNAPIYTGRWLTADHKSVPWLQFGREFWKGSMDETIGKPWENHRKMGVNHGKTQGKWWFKHYQWWFGGDLMGIELFQTTHQYCFSIWREHKPPFDRFFHSVKFHEIMRFMLIRDITNKGVTAINLLTLGHPQVLKGCSLLIRRLESPWARPAQAAFYLLRQWTTPGVSENPRCWAPMNHYHLVI